VGEAPVTPVYALDSSYLTFPTNRAITGPKHSPSLIMTRNNMDSRCLRCFPRVSWHQANIHSQGCTYGEQPWLKMSLSLRGSVDV
jgi:hypothetical protein